MRGEGGAREEEGEDHDNVYNNAQRCGERKGERERRKEREKKRGNGASCVRNARTSRSCVPFARENDRFLSLSLIRLITTLLGKLINKLRFARLVVRGTVRTFMRVRTLLSRK